MARLASCTSLRMVRGGIESAIILLCRTVVPKLSVLEMAEPSESLPADRLFEIDLRTASCLFRAALRSTRALLQTFRKCFTGLQPCYLGESSVLEESEEQRG